jgi:Na+/H+ antiporter NhaD/arsenite permease-like protein
MLAAALIFTVTGAVVAVSRVPGWRVDRTGAAVVGAALMVACGVVTPEDAYRLVDLATLVLLFSMMIVVGHLRLAGFLGWAAAAVARRARTPRQRAPGGPRPGLQRALRRSSSTTRSAWR